MLGDINDALSTLSEAAVDGVKRAVNAVRVLAKSAAFFSKEAGIGTANTVARIGRKVKEANETRKDLRQSNREKKEVIKQIKADFAKQADKEARAAKKEKIEEIKKQYTFIKKDIRYQHKRDFAKTEAEKRETEHAKKEVRMRHFANRMLGRE